MVIHAPEHAVMERLVPVEGQTYYSFNLHKLFPEKVPADDPTGDKSWDYDRWVDNTGSKWSPEVAIRKCVDASITILAYDTARAPNNPTLRCLHTRTGWTIVNEYEEPGMAFEGTFTCKDGTWRDDEREYRPVCEICDVKKPATCFLDDADDMICDECRRDECALSSRFDDLAQQSQAETIKGNPRPQLFTDGQYLQLLTNGQKSSQLPDFQPMPVVKLFTPDGAATWLLSEIYPDDPSTAYGLCDLGMGHPEFGDINLPEIASLRGKLGLPVERDLHFTAIKTLIEYADEARPLGRINA